MTLSADHSRFSFTEEATLVRVDPKKIINSFCTRPVLKRNVKVLSSSIEQNGYERSRWLIGRVATCPEIKAFYQREPFCYSEEKAGEVATSAMKSERANGHTYLYDGHLRKYAVLELLEAGKMEKDFRLPCLIGRHLTDEEEIAFSISCNAVNEYSVPLSPLALLIRCFEFDQTVNDDRPKLLPASDVAKRMVHFSSTNMIANKHRARMAETRRQYLSVSRRLLPPTVDYFRQLLFTDEAGLERAFNIANLKSIPKKLSEMDQLSLAKRMTKAYENSLPTKKPISASEVAGQIVQIRRAGIEVQKFLSKCGYDELPSQLQRIVSTMRDTQQLDVELTHNSNLDALFKPLVEVCKNVVPGGTNHLSLAEAGEVSMERNESDGGMGSVSKTILYPEDEVNDEDLVNSCQQRESLSVVEERSLPPSSTQLSDQGGYESTSPRCSEMSDIEKAHSLFGASVYLENQSPAQFSTGNDNWTLVEGKADFVVMCLPTEVTASEMIDKIIKHAGMAMKETGVAHVFCSHLQFSLIYQSVTSNHMTMLAYPMIYINDAKKVRKRTLTKCPQDNSQCAAIFWRHAESRRKPHFSAAKSYIHSQTPAWTNTVTHVSPSWEKFGTKRIRSYDYDLTKSILSQWCRPGGICYNPLANSFSFVTACVDLGISYIGLQEDEEMFSKSLSKLLLEHEKRNKRQKIVSSSDIDLADE